jgi:hypothetical protein
MVTLAQAINPCTNNAVADGVLRLPANKNEGNIPLIAISTGTVDGLECVLRKMGIDDAEFSNPNGTGRIRFYQDANGAGARYNAQTPSATQLYGSQTEIDQYDAVIFACPADEYRKLTAAQQRVVSYADRGGRVFATHYNYVWIFGQENPNDPNYVTPWAATGTWRPNHHGYDNARRFLLNVGFTKGQNFAQWLNTSVVNALANGTATASGLPTPAAPEISIVQSRHDLDRPVVAPAQEWAYATNNTPTNGPGEAMTLHYTFNTPWGAQPANQCGRVVYSDFHVSTGTISRTTNFPDECNNSTLTAQEKILAFMLLDLTSCITPDTGPPPTCTPLTCQQQNIMCGPAGNGCGGIIQCGPCPPGQTCQGNQCVANPCTPRTCQQAGANCGPIADGCGGIIDCGTCVPPLTCGGGGTPNVCGGGTPK